LNAVADRPAVSAPAYTGPERRWSRSREWSGWAQRREQSANQSALEYSRDADLLLEIRKRQKDRAKLDALWNGYWHLKEQRDKFRARVADETSPWFDGSALDGQVRF
jgi:hypothetical protein